MGCGKPSTETPHLIPYTETRTLMGTVVSITVYAPTFEKGEEAASDAYRQMEALERLLSGYTAESDVSRVNRMAGASAPVSPPTLFVIERALEMSKLTGGAFDITVGPLVALWRDSVVRARLPSDADLQAALLQVGYRKVKVSEGAEEATVSIPVGTSIDLGGIAKGYIVDQAVGVLRRHVSSALVNAGGDVYALGAKPGGEPWVIGVQDPRRPDDLSAYIDTLYVTDRAVATSGNYARYFEIEGKRYSHIVDPRTGRPVDSVPSATIIARDATTADALATAVSVLGATGTRELVLSLPGVESLLFVRTEEGRWERHASPGISALTTKPPRLD